MLCECGCGQQTKLAPRTHTPSGWVKGQPLRFVRYHHLRQFQQEGAEHPRWLGDEIGYHNLHQWVSQHKTKTGKCSTCSHRGYTEWANISGVYLRDLDDYVEMCKLCHAEFDNYDNYER
jgi:hypothetical protein